MIKFEFYDVIKKFKNYVNMIIDCQNVLRTFWLDLKIW